MELANSTQILVDDVFKYTASLGEARGQHLDTITPSAGQYNFYVSVDAMDWDICKRIRELQLSREDAYTTIEQGGVIEWIDGQEFHDYSEWFEATDQRAKDKVTK